MYGIRWLVAVALAACLATPDVQAQTWLRWGKTPLRQQTDPSKQVVPPKRQTIAIPVLTLPERQPVSEPVASLAVQRGPSVTIIEEASQPATASVTPPAVPQVSPVILSAIVAPAALNPPLPAPMTKREPATATPLLIEEAPVQSAPLAVAAVAAPPQPATLCSDCPTVDELKATSTTPDPAEIAPEEQKIQSEIKRRLLQGR